MERIDREFKSLLRHHDFAYLEAHSGAVYGVWQDFRLAYLNPQWFRFARENGGEPGISSEWGLGRSILDCIPGDIKGFFQGKFQECLSARAVWNYQYECSSDAVYRRYHQIVYPLIDQKGLLFVNSRVVESPMDPRRRPAKAPDQSVYRDDNGFFCQCAHCRRMKNFRDNDGWDWVPEWVKQCPEPTSHTFCPSCFAHYFPMAAQGK